MKNALTLPAPAKLNLFLHITGRRPDGYHNLQTLFRILDYGDLLTFESRSDDVLSLHCRHPDITMDDNLILQAARALKKHCNSTPGASIHLNKKLPIGAGLGGGSSDAATTLIGLNRLWETGLGIDELSDLGLELGADIPLFVRGYSAWAEGIGEKLTQVELEENYYLVLTPECKVSTREIFSNQQLTRDSSAIKMADFLAGRCRNDCENLVRKQYWEVDEALNWLNLHSDARMTGTGSSVFASFDQLESANELLAKIPAHMSAFVAKGVNQSPLHTTEC